MDGYDKYQAEEIISCYKNELVDIINLIETNYELMNLYNNNVNNDMMLRKDSIVSYCHRIFDCISKERFE